MDFEVRGDQCPRNVRFNFVLPSTYLNFQQSFHTVLGTCLSRYEKSDWGWNGKVKKEEMTDEDARYLIARSAEGKPLGFSHYRFDMDFDDEVLYW